MASQDHKCSHFDEKLCCHSSEAILLILSRTPWRLSIKELSDITRFHRNTLRPTLYALKDQNKIQSTGDSKSSQYYYGGITDFYRRQAKAIDALDLPVDQIKAIAKNIGYNLVKNTLEEALEEGPEFKHDSLYEAVLHIKMAYPFSDIIIGKDGKVKSGTAFTATSLSGDFDINKISPNDFNLRIHACLCDGNDDDHISCAMVIGALQGAIEGACGTRAEVKWNGKGKDTKYGIYCQYRITSEMNIPDKINEPTKQQTKSPPQVMMSKTG
jgi:hypothetical protein